MKPILIVAGKRKTAVAKARLYSGNGHLTYNGRPINSLFLMHSLALREPLDIFAKVLGKVDVDVKVTSSGGGTEGQIQAARLAVAKALLAYKKSAELKKAYLHYDRNLLVADTRRKEAYKPGDSKARAKRQKSYR